jgi:hypothetical protein
MEKNETRRIWGREEFEKTNENTIRFGSILYHNDTQRPPRQGSHRALQGSHKWHSRSPTSSRTKRPRPARRGPAVPARLRPLNVPCSLGRKKAYLRTSGVECRGSGAYALAARMRAMVPASGASSTRSHSQVICATAAASAASGLDAEEEDGSVCGSSDGDDCERTETAAEAEARETVAASEASGVGGIATVRRRSCAKNCDERECETDAAEAPPALPTPPRSSIPSAPMRVPVPVPVPVPARLVLRSVLAVLKK